MAKSDNENSGSNLVKVRFIRTVLKPNSALKIQEITEKVDEIPGSDNKKVVQYTQKVSSVLGNNHNLYLAGQVYDVPKSEAEYYTGIKFKTYNGDYFGAMSAINMQNKQFSDSVLPKTIAFAEYV